MYQKFLSLPLLRLLKVNGTDTDRPVNCDFLLMKHSNHGPILYRFQDKQRCRSKIVKKNPTPEYLMPAEAVALEIL